VPNLYGVAGTQPALVYTSNIGGTNTTCTAGAETNVFASASLFSFDRGVYYPVAWGNIVLSFGATQSTSLNIAIRVNNGADINLLQGNIPAGSANLAVNFPFALAGPAMPTTFWPPGSIVQVSVLVTGFNATANVGYSGCIIGVMRAPDQ
jgi:hypothetical protein